MSINLVKLLPASIRDTKWGDIIAVSQNYLNNTLKPNLIDTIKNKWNFDDMDEQNIKDLAFFVSFDLTMGAGYTDTLSYLLKEAKTFVPRIKTKTTVKGYDYLFYIFLLTGYVYPMLQIEEGNIEPWLDWLTFPETEIETYTIDNSLTLDATISWSLDELSIINLITRHMQISYFPRFIENATEFMSENTAKAFYNDVMQMKRSIEFPHFEPNLELYTDNSGTEYLTNYQSEDGLITADQKSIMLNGGDLITAFTIEFGSGGHSVVDSSITAVETLIQSYNLSTFEIILQETNTLNVKNIISTSLRWYDFSEVCLKNVSGDVLYYSTFPEIKYYSKMYSSVYLYFSIV